MRLVKLLDPKIAVLEYSPGGKLRRLMWLSVKLRKGTRCIECSSDIVAGTSAFSPLTNDVNRGHRLCESCFSQIVSRKEKDSSCPT